MIYATVIIACILSFLCGMATNMRRLGFRPQRIRKGRRLLDFNDADIVPFKMESNAKGTDLKPGYFLVRKTSNWHVALVNIEFAKRHWSNKFSRQFETIEGVYDFFLRLELPPWEGGNRLVSIPTAYASISHMVKGEPAVIDISSLLHRHLRRTVIKVETRK